MIPIKNKEYLRSVIFGIEDSLVSTTGLIAGISVGSSRHDVVFLAGVVAVCIEAVSMGVGEYLSDDAVQELDKIKRHRENPFISGILMFVAYFTAGLIPLVPAVVFNYPTSVVWSILFALIGLFLTGYVKGKILNSSPFKGGFKIMFLGGIAALIGLALGYIFRI